MDYSWSSDSQWPDAHDYLQLETMYNHVDFYNSYDDAEAGTGDGGGDAKPCRGRNCRFNAPEVPPMGVRVHRNEHHEIWVARGRGDSLWIHHVTLVPPEYQ
jgi:hypothetical protein